MSAVDALGLALALLMLAQCAGGRARPARRADAGADGVGPGGGPVERLGAPTGIDRLLRAAAATLALPLAACESSKNSGGDPPAPPAASAPPPAPAPQQQPRTFPQAGPPPAVTWASAGADVVESQAASVTLSVAIGPASAATTTVDWTTEDGTAAAGSDYEARSGTLVFPPGAGVLTRTVVIPVLDDAASEPEEAFHVVLSNAGNGVLVAARATVVVRNDDAAFRVDAPRAVEGAAGTGASLVFAVSLEHPVAVPVILDHALDPGSAAGAADLASDPAGSVRFEPGEVRKEVALAVAGDGAAEDDEDVVLVFTPRGGGAPFQASGVIIDDDTLRISIDSPRVVEGRPGETTNLAFTVTITPEPPSLVTVAHAITGGTALRDYDYEHVPQRTIPFRSGRASQMILVPVFGDGAVEDDETIVVSLSSPSGGAEITPGGGVGTIVDDDGEREAAGTPRPLTGLGAELLLAAATASPAAVLQAFHATRTAVEATLTNHYWNADDSVDAFGAPTADADEVFRAIEAARGRDIAVLAFTTDIPPAPGQPSWTERMESRSGIAFIAAGHDSRRANLADAARAARNGIAAYAADNDRVPAATCAPPIRASDDCINVNMRRGANADALLDHALAAAKLAGYAALLHQAFEPATGADTVRILQGGANESNVFSFAKALERGGLPAIGNGKRYTNAQEHASGGRAIETALAGRTGTLTLAPPGGGGWSFTAFRTLDGPVPAAGPAARGFAAALGPFRLGAVFEERGFLGRARARVLGAAGGRWLQAGWRGGAALGPWRIDADAELGIGTADAAGSPVVAGYGRVLASAWGIRASRRGNGWSAALSLRQPARTERARIRLRDGEGVVRESGGRELRLGLRLEAGRWTLGLSRVLEPGHAAGAPPADDARLRYALSW